MDERERFSLLIFDHTQEPRNRSVLEDAVVVPLRSPNCGDLVTVYLRLKGDRVDALTFEAKGCGISMASASLMTEVLTGMTRSAAQALGDVVGRAVVNRPMPLDPPLADDLALFVSMVAQMPLRTKCALLPWTALRMALAKGVAV